MDLDFNAILSNDGHAVITDFGIYHLTGNELLDEPLAVASAKIKCRLAYDSGWYERKAWDGRLTAQTVL